MGSQLKAKLKEQGISMKEWALKRGYVPRTVSITMQRWGCRCDRTPHGGLARQIMADLRRDLGE